MLVLSRKNGAGVQVDTKDGPIQVLATASKSGRVRIAVQAPGKCPILRLEADGTILKESRDKCKVK